MSKITHCKIFIGPTKDGVEIFKEGGKKIARYYDVEPPYTILDGYATMDEVASALNGFITEFYNQGSHLKAHLKKTF